MAVITKSIGATGRDYTTATSWESQLDGGSYASGDEALGQGYNDAAFDEAVTIDGGGTVGLTKRTLSVASGQRHTGIAGTGARNVRTAGGAVITNGINATGVEWWEVDVNGNGTAAIGIRASATNRTGQDYRSNIVHGVNNTTGTTALIDCQGGASATNCRAIRNICYDAVGTGGSIFGIRLTTSGATAYVCNNTIHNIRSNSTISGAVYCISCDEDADTRLKNNIATDPGGTTSGTKQCYSDTSYTTTTSTNNLSSDTSASGTGSLTNKTSANQFVLTTVGSEDLHLKSGADAIDAGADLVTTPTDVNIDIDGRDVDAQGDTWDIGADEYVASTTFFPPHPFIINQAVNRAATY